MKNLILLIFIGLAINAKADDLVIDVPLLDVPFNFQHDVNYPSMRQAMLVSTDFYQGAHKLMQGDDDFPRLGRRLLILGFDYVSTWLPPSSAWMHEEWHRSVMTTRQIKSYNDVYNLNFFSDAIAVSHVTDADLTRLKRDHPADSVRLSAAGIESEAEQNFLIERRHFFDDVSTWDQGVLWLNYLNNYSYISNCASPDSDTFTADEIRDEGSNVPKRDFTGLDCDGWVYDLFRPDEPYAARGVHPSGTGIDRYRSWSDLSAEEQRFLKRQRTLNLLNFVDPFLFGISAFGSSQDGEPLLWNATLRHHLTSFGYTIDVNVFLKKPAQSWLFTLHNQFNAVRYFPGFTAERIGMDLPWPHLQLSTRLSLWTQPKDQRVKSASGLAGGLLGLTLTRDLSANAQAYLGLDAKSRGLVAGNPYLDANVCGITGLIFQL
jgi:hypothetical protein